MRVRLPKRKPDTHKGDYGHLLVVGASPGLTGAVCLCAQSALIAGAGLVTAGVPRCLNDIIEIKLTEVMSLPLPEIPSGALSEGAFGVIKKFLPKIDALAVGCGGGRAKSTVNLFVKLIEQISLPMVVDADALYALASRREVLKNRKTDILILTPHEGEFSRLTGISVSEVHKRRKELAKEFALRYNLTLVLKGYRTIVTDGKRFFENSTGNPGMATAGSGDVLTGIIGGLLVQGMEPFVAAKIGVYLHGLSGDLVEREKTQYCLIASDIIEFLPQAVKKVSGIGN